MEHLRELLTLESLDRGAEPAVTQPVPEGFVEEAYLEAFPDIEHSVRMGEWRSGLEHYMAHGRREYRLADPRYSLSLRGLGSSVETPKESFPAGDVDVAFVSQSGFCLVIGWIDDRTAELGSVVFTVRGEPVCKPAAIARCRRSDAEEAVGAAAGTLLGFWSVFRLPTTQLPPACGVDIVLEKQRKNFTLEPKRVSDSQFRDITFEYFAAREYFGNPALESFVQLQGGAGIELLSINISISRSITTRAYVERFGPDRRAFRGSIIVCLFGKHEFLFLQNALFSSGRDAADYEYIYVSNSPELTEALQKEARISEHVYGVSQTLVVLPGNAGFGAANNVAAQYARSDRLMIVNPDVFPRDADWARSHSAVLEGLPANQTDMFGVPLFYDDGSLMHGGMYFELDGALSVKLDGVTRRDLVRVEHYGKGAPPGTESFLRSRPVPAVTGAFISANRHWFERLGGFSEDYVFGHYEDADLCLKSFTAGRPVWLHNIPFWHLEGKGSERRPAHEGGSLVNRWHFTRSWGEIIRDGFVGRTPERLRGAEDH